MRVPAWWAASLLLPVLRPAVAGPVTLVTAGAFVGIADRLHVAGRPALDRPAGRLPRQKAGRWWRIWRRHLADAGFVRPSWSPSARGPSSSLTSRRTRVACWALRPCSRSWCWRSCSYDLHGWNARLHRLRSRAPRSTRCSAPTTPCRRSSRCSRASTRASRGIGRDRRLRPGRSGPLVTGRALRTAVRRARGRAAPAGGRCSSWQVTGEDTAFQGDSDEDGSVSAYAARDEGRAAPRRAPGLPLAGYPTAGRRARLRARGPRARPAARPVRRDRRDPHRGPSIDVLTGLPNRRGVSRALQDAMTHVRHGGRYAVLLLDIDHFKPINDLLGHSTATAAWPRSGPDPWRESIRGVDVAGASARGVSGAVARRLARGPRCRVASGCGRRSESGGLSYADRQRSPCRYGVAYAPAARTVRTRPSSGRTARSTGPRTAGPQPGRRIVPARR